MSHRASRLASAATLVLSILSSVAVLAGPAPNILIWQPPFTASESGDALLADLAVLGEDAALVTNLFAYSPDLSAHEIVMGVVGTTPDTHVIDATEGAALDAYVQNGGLLFLDGADCYNYDPEVQGGYNVRPIFGLDPGSDGDGVFLGDIVGIGNLADFGFDFDYLGEPSFLDELVPVTSIAILRKKVNNEVHAVFHPAYGSGRSIGFSCEYGGLYDFPTAAAQGRAAQALTMRQQLLAACLELLRTGSAPVGIGDATAPPALALYPAVPNPFSSGTTIRYDLSQGERVRLTIYDVNGRRVRTLVDRVETEGAHVARWDGRDGAGIRVASGVYFLALDTGKTALQRRVVLLK